MMMAFGLEDWASGSGSARALTCLVNRRFFFFCFPGIGRSVGGWVGWRVGWVIGWLAGKGMGEDGLFFWLDFHDPFLCLLLLLACRAPCTVRLLLDTTVACLFVFVFVALILFPFYFIFVPPPLARLWLWLFFYRRKYGTRKRKPRNSSDCCGILLSSV
jgi:hypothetical protein